MQIINCLNTRKKKETMQGTVNKQKKNKYIDIL